MGWKKPIRALVMVVLAAPLVRCGGPTGPSAGGRTSAKGGKAPRARVTTRTNVLPIPNSRGVLRLNLGKVLASPTLKPHALRVLSKLTTKVTADARVAPLIVQCGLRFDQNVDTFAMDLPSGPNGHDAGIYVFGGRFEAPRVLACLEKLARQAGKPVERFTVGSVSGLREPGRKGPVLLAPRRDRLVYADARSVKSVRAVLTGAERSISDAPLYRTTRGSTAQAPLGLVVIPSVREALRQIPFPVAKEILAMGARVRLPGGNMELWGLIPFGSPRAATRFVKQIPMLLSLFRAKSPLVDRLARGLRLTLRPDSPTVVEMRLDLSKPDLKAVIAKVRKQLK